MGKALSILAGLISIGSLCTVATESERVAEARSSQRLDGSGCFRLDEKVAFTTTRDNPNFTPVQNAGEIYLMDPDGTNPQRITNNFVQDSFGVLSPDGKKFVFDSNRLRLETDPINLVDLFVMATDGSEQTHLTRGSSAAWAPDSRNIVYHGSASGTGLPIRMDPGAPSTDSDIFILNVDDAAMGQPAPINMTNTPTLIEDDPHWSPDGTKIVYTAHLVNDHPTFSNTAEVFVIDAGGSGSPVRLTFNNEEERAAAWSPDGTKIVFMCRYGGTDFEICTTNPDGSGLVQITNNALQELSIRWSMDGTQFWFNRPVPYAPGPVRMQLFRISVDGTGETQMTDTVGINLFPTAGWFRVRTECSSSDSAASTAPRIIVGQNSFEELKRLVPVK